MKTFFHWTALIGSHGQSIHATHSIVEWLLVGVAACTVGYAFYKAVRHTLYPGETSPDHVKWRIFDDDGGRG